MTIRLSRSLVRCWTFSTNATPRAIDRRDRRTLGIWYIEVYAGPLYGWISGPARQQ